MQNDDFIPDLKRPSLAVDSSGWQRAAFAVVITALIFGAVGYLLGIGTAKKRPRSDQEISFLTPPIPTIVLLPSQNTSPMPFLSKTFYPVPTTNPVLTANWKTYKSDKYGISFQYPPYMYANPSNRSRTNRHLFPDDVEFQNKQIPLYDFGNKSFEKNKAALEKLYDGSTNGWLIISYEIPREYAAFMIDLYAKQLLDEAMSKWTDVKAEQIIVGRRIGRIISGYNIALANEKRPVRELLIPLTGGGYVIPFFQENAITLDEFNQILSTFKFTDRR